MFCSKCGKEIPDESKFCPECGTNPKGTVSSGPPTAPSEKKSFNKKKGCLGCLGIIVVLFVILGIVGAMSSSDSKKAASQKPAEPAFTIDVEGIGKIKGGISSNVGIAVADVQTPNSIGGKYHQVTPQGKFVVVKIAVSNGQKDAITVDSNSFKLVDDQNREFSVSTEASTAIQMQNGDAKGFLTKMNPGIASMFTFPFDVPQNVQGLKLKAKGGFAGKEIDLPLEVQMVQ